jgi:DNA-binding MarR family transcriptional regulator
VPVAGETQASKTLTQIVRLVTNGLMTEVFAVTSVAHETVTAAQFEVLRYVDRHVEPTMKQVADGLNISAAAATKAVRGLAEERDTALVERLPGVDRRTVHLATTQAGRDLVRRIADGFRRRLEEVFERMSADELAAFEYGTQAFLEAALMREADCDAACLRCGVDGVDTCVVRITELALTGGQPRPC